ncbi:hypothetical protein AB0O16_01140 [Microbacterium sp. NPDC089180]|uniref:HTTM domain-containing protein n=1 Tax=Microbacterium galbum TaxID=3075994 RepID=A0ABU3T4Z5_9MICO|nr:hypothetical protein [Microbacterium sp. KSW4-17]MDU0366398.1 hypothetical protein [Microbacterium sp. KSW4-17]
MITFLERTVARAAASYQADGRFLAALRIAYGAWIIFLPVDITWIAGLPDDFVNPRPGLFGFIHSVPPIELLVAISVVRFVLAVLLVIGIATIPVSLFLTLTIMAAAGLSYSFSKVDHFILFELVPVFLGLAGWGSRWSLDAVIRRRRGRTPAVTRGVPILLFAFTIGWGMLSAAAPKIAGGWLDPTRDATRGYLAKDIAADDKLGALGPWMLTFDNHLFWKALDYATIAAEGLLFFFVLTPLLFRCWLALLSCFHIAVFLTLGISFIDYTLVYAVFFAPAVMWVVRRASIGRAVEPSQELRA